ncbi:hypothetical protein OHA21_00210 [Actinoplanes sp. NBC_00393]|uniref:hypothetical protein n=1 Tax=Actinoplanes sp. NBC_00393 TaxID=2975953 RepID=UPI002E1D2F2A
MTNLPPWQRSCDCRCIAHHQLQRTSYDDPDCACTITCATQPTTLLAEQWGCALFLDKNGDLWAVTHLANSAWDWQHAAQIDTRDLYDTHVTIEHLLRLTNHVLGTNPR